MRTAWFLPVALNGLLAFGAPAVENEVEERDVPVYGNIKLTYATEAPTVALNLIGRDATTEAASCLSKPTNLPKKSRTRARSHIRHCGESGSSCGATSTGAVSSKATPSSKHSSASASKHASASASASASKHASVSASESVVKHAYAYGSASASVLTTDYTTVVTTIYDTTCPGTSTVTYGTVTKAVEVPSSSKVTSTYTTVYPTTITVYPSGKASAEQSTHYVTVDVTSTKIVPCTESKIPVTYTTESTYYKTETVVKYTTVPCSGTKTVTSESSTYTYTYPSSSVETTTVTTKVPATTTLTITTESTVPYTKAVPTSSASAGATEYKTTVITTIYTTTCPGTTTITSYGTTFTKTYDSSTVTTETLTKTYAYTTKSKHHSHSHHGHGYGNGTAASTGSLKTYPVKSGAASTGSLKTYPVKSGASSSALGTSSKVSASRVSASASASRVSASASLSASASVKSASKSLSSSKTPFVCATPSPAPKCTPCEGQPGSDPKKYCGLTINDNSYDVIPETCRTVVYDFEITNTTVNPDGIERLGLLVNGDMPGPTIEANWGDWIVVHVHNKMQDNGTSIHFHGARQNYTNEMDGATSVTQCPIAPGESYTYKFRASNYGHSWYHSHFALQTYNGVFGPMIIHGPHSAEYDVDAGVLSLQDWSHDTVDMQWSAAETVGTFPDHGPRTMDLGLINGLNVWQGKGERYVLEQQFEAGKSYLLRLINVANQATFKFYIDGHTLQVISADYVPIVPYTTTIVNLNPGQRYEVIVKADQTPGSYWVRSDSQDACSAMTNSKDVKAIVNYKGFDDEPTSTAYTYTDECIDEPLASLVPVVPMDVGAQDESLSEFVLVGAGPNTPNLYKWTLSGSTFVSRWNDPTLWSLAVNDTINNYAGSLQISYPKLGEWVYLVIQSPIPLPHPIHFHGHDFHVVGAGTGLYAGQPLNLKAPPRRDTALMPHTASTGGYLVIAWKTDNPGAWLMHCHIGFHAAMGFTMEIIEGEPDLIKSTLTDTCQLDKTCKAWNKYQLASGQEDVGN